MRIISLDDVKRWHEDQRGLASYTRTIGAKQLDAEYLEQALGLPLHLRLLVQVLSQQGPDIAPDTLASIPFFSLCKGLLLPLAGLHPDKVAYLFGMQAEPPPDAVGREALIARFLDRPLGLSLQQKLACLLGDPYYGRPGTLLRDSLLRLLQSVRLAGRRELLDQLAREGEIGAMFAHSRPTLRLDPPLSAAEVLETLRLLPRQGRLFKFALLRSLLQRCGKLEAYFLARLVLRRAGLGVDYQGPLVARALAEQFGAAPEQVSHAIALSDVFETARVLQSQGNEGLKRVQLKPLVPLKPALAAHHGIEQIRHYPVWAERKYDGIRLLLHKASDSRGTALCGAYTRNRGDWLELVRGIDATIKLIPARSLIIDGELYGVRLGSEGLRPASVSDVYGALQGDRAGLQLRYAAFDLIYHDGGDLTGWSLQRRRERLNALIAPLAQLPLPIPIALTEGQLADDLEHLKRLYGHFRGQGYEGLIAKDPAGPYLLAARDPSWIKRKPQLTLDLVLLGALLAVTTKGRSGLFGSYLIGIRRGDGTFDPIGDVAGLDWERDREIQLEIAREGLLTGRRIERSGATGTRSGFELRPHIVVTVKFSEIKRDSATKQFSLRDAKVLTLRPDKSPFEADDIELLERHHLRQSLG